MFAMSATAASVASRAITARLVKTKAVRSTTVRAFNPSSGNPNRTFTVRAAEGEEAGEKAAVDAETESTVASAAAADAVAAAAADIAAPAADVPVVASAVEAVVEAAAEAEADIVYTLSGRVGTPFTRVLVGACGCPHPGQAIHVYRCSLPNTSYGLLAKPFTCPGALWQSHPTARPGAEDVRHCGRRAVQRGHRRRALRHPPGKALQNMGSRHHAGGITSRNRVQNIRPLALTQEPRAGKCFEGHLTQFLPGTCSSPRLGPAGHAKNIRRVALTQVTRFGKFVEGYFEQFLPDPAAWCRARCARGGPRPSWMAPSPRWGGAG